MQHTLVHRYLLTVTNPDRLGGKPTVAGTHVSVSFIPRLEAGIERPKTTP